MQQHVNIEGGDSSHDKSIVFFDGGKDGVDVKRIEQNVSSAPYQGAEVHIGDAVGMAQWEHTDAGNTGRDIDGILLHFGIGIKTLVGVHDTLWFSGCTGSVDECSQLVIVDHFDFKFIRDGLNQVTVCERMGRHIGIDEDDIFDARNLLSAGINLGQKVEAADGRFQPRYPDRYRWSPHRPPKN